MSDCEHESAYRPEGWRFNLYCPDCECELEPEGLDHE
jgi:hypothetical protein